MAGIVLLNRKLRSPGIGRLDIETQIEVLERIVQAIKEPAAAKPFATGKPVLSGTVRASKQKLKR